MHNHSGATNKVNILLKDVGMKIEPMGFECVPSFKRCAIAGSAELASQLASLRFKVFVTPAALTGSRVSEPGFMKPTDNWIVWLPLTRLNPATDDVMVTLT